MNQGNINTYPEPQNPFPTESEPTADGHTPNFAIVKAIIDDGIERSKASGDPSLKVEVDGKTKFLSRFLANDIYKYGLSETETSELLEEYLYLRLDGEHLTTPTKPQADLGSAAAAYTIGGGCELDWRERQFKDSL